MGIAAKSAVEHFRVGRQDHATRRAHPRIALFGIWGVQNLGNECTLDAMLSNVHQRLPEADIYCISYEPEDTMRCHNLPAIAITQRITDQSSSLNQSGVSGQVRRWLRFLFRRIPAEIFHWFHSIRSLYGTDLVIMTGTGMLTDYSTNAFGYPYDIFKWALAARLAGCKVRFVSVGVGPIYQAMSRRFIKVALRCADYRSYRDDSSRQRLVGFGLGGSNDPVFPDLAFSLPRQLFTTSSTTPRRQVMVGLGVMKFVDIHATQEAEREASYVRYLHTMCDFVEWLVGRGYGVRIVQGDARYDQSVRRKLKQMLEERGIGYGSPGIVDEESTSTEALIAQLTHTDVVISPRFHNLILAAILNKPVISISYDPKNDALLEGFGLANYCQPIAEVNLDRLIDQFLEVESRRKTIQAQLRKTVDEYRNRLDDQYAEILCDMNPEQTAVRS